VALLEGKPPYYGLVLGLLLGAVVLFFFNRLYFAPMRGTIDAKDRELGQLQTKIQEGNAAKAKLPQFRDEVRRLELDLEKLLRILPARRNTPELLRQVRTLAEQGDFNLKLFKPANPVEKDFYSEWPITVNLDGNYHNLALFFDRISHFPRILNIDDLKIDALGKQTPSRTVAASFVAKTFVYKEPEDLGGEDLDGEEQQP
jgi:type IV pilus assembly protein PilO